jgi:amino acid transporter
MRLETKTTIAKATLSLLTVVVALVLLGVLVFVLCAGLQINPFKETTTAFLVAAFVGLIGVAVVLVLLNVATNVSLIADARISEMKIEPHPGVLRKWSVVFVVAAVALVALIFAGTYLSKEKYLSVVRRQADEVLRNNKDLLDEVSRLLASHKPEDYKRIAEIRSFLQNQRSGLPQLTVIYSAPFEGKPAFYKVDYYDWNQKSEVYIPTYFQCTQNLDCEYLSQFFAGQNSGVFQKYTVRDDQFYIYIPFVGKESRFVLLFDRRNSYGKVGS